MTIQTRTSSAWLPSLFRRLVFAGLATSLVHVHAQSQGMASGNPPHADSPPHHVPVTADDFVKTGPVIFKDVTREAGLSAWKNRTGTLQKNVIIEAKGSGVCLLDFDGDGWLDIYLVNGSTFDALAGKSPAPHAALFRNNHDGTFTDVAGKAGVENDRWGLGCAVGDYDNDGHPDLYVTNLGKNRLYHNDGHGTFTDLADHAGVALSSLGDNLLTDYTGATFGDYDGDGRLDLFVAGYIRYNPAQPPIAGTKSVQATTCRYRGVDVMCGPRGLQGTGDHLFHNNGDGTFSDVSQRAGVSDPHGYYGLGTAFVDVNDDGKLDLIVANDSTPNYLYINQGDGSFADESYDGGIAFNESGREIANMGLALGDYENKGHLSFVSTTFSDDYDVLFHNDGMGHFEDSSYSSKIAQPTLPFVGFGDGFLDYDNDGWLDLFIANGHVYPGVDQHPDWDMSYAQRPLLFRNNQDGTFALVPAVEGTGLASLAIGRGAAFGDLFNEGKTDVVINNLDGPLLLLRNVYPSHNHWLTLSLVGGPRSPRDAVGAKVYLTANGTRQRRDVVSGASYLSSSDMRLHFGIGSATKIDALEIHWPSGTIQQVQVPGVDRIITVAEHK